MLSIFQYSSGSTFLQGWIWSIDKSSILSIGIPHLRQIGLAPLFFNLRKSKTIILYSLNLALMSLIPNCFLYDFSLSNMMIISVPQLYSIIIRSQIRTSHVVSNSAVNCFALDVFGTLPLSYPGSGRGSGPNRRPPDFQSITKHISYRLCLCFVGQFFTPRVFMRVRPLHYLPSQPGGWDSNPRSHSPNEMITKTFRTD